MPSVASRILLKLRDRLLTIRGQGRMVHDLQGRVFLRQPSYALDFEPLPAVFIVRRNGGGTTLTPSPSVNETPSVDTVIYDVIGAVPASDETTLAGEELVADLRRALECPKDLFLFDDSVKKNLLSEELRLISLELDPPEDARPYDFVGVGVACTYPHRYGDPDHVA